MIRGHPQALPVFLKAFETGVNGISWKNDFPVVGRTNYPLLFDRSRERKPAYYAVADLGGA